MNKLVMHSPKTLYIRNLPSRPKSKTNLIKLILMHINPANKYVHDATLPLPRHETIGNSDLNFLDEKNHLLAISLSRSPKLRNQCFLTFTSHVAALEFKNNFTSNLTIGGRKADIQFAHGDSFLGLTLDDPSLLNKVLKTRLRRKILANDRALKENLLLKRRARRLRSKLRKKGIDEQEISEKVDQLEKSRHSTITKAAAKKTAKGTKAQEKKKTPVAVTSENPPNRILLVQHLPQSISTERLMEIFKHGNLVEVRLVAIRRVAFVEYQSIDDAKRVKEMLGPTYDLDDHQISIGFAK